MNRVSFNCALVIAVFAAFGSISAHELKDRELRPLVDIPRDQQPVEIVSIKIKGQPVEPGEKIQGDDDWLQGLSFKVKNVSDKPIAYIAISLRFTQPKRVVAFTLSHGVDYSRGEPRRPDSVAAIQPGESIDLTLSRDRWPNFLRILALGEMPRDFDLVPYYIERISFDDDPDVIWESGYLKRRDPTAFHNFKIIERYALRARN